MFAVRPGVIVRALGFSLASNAAVLLVIVLGLALWPERLPVNSQNVFWLASGINTAGLLLLGLRYWPVLLLNAFPPWLLGLEPLGMCVVGAAANAGEAVLAAGIILRFGHFAGKFDHLRPVGALVVASFLAPLVNTLVIPAFLCAQGLFPWSDYGRALGNWNLSNGAAMLMVAPLLVAVMQRDWNPPARTAERIFVGMAAAALCFVAFDAVFRGTGMNFAFLVFPVVIYTAVRFGPGETSAILGLMLAAIYGALAWHGRGLPVAQAVEAIWFVQAFCWVLAATGLLVAALGVERRRAETRSLEASLREERARLAALRYQINPHFLFNALNSIRACLPLSEAVPREMITDLAGYLRTTLDGGETEQAPLRDEIRSVQEYLRIEQRRFGERLVPRFLIEPGAGEKIVPVFLLQPLVENAIRHGLEASREPCRVEVSARCGEGRLHLEVANSGAWRDPGPRRGVGLENTRRRLAALYRSEAAFAQTEADGWVRVQISLPLLFPKI
jgi:integral membrane sensor domain MASE1